MSAGGVIDPSLSVDFVICESFRDNGLEFLEAVFGQCEGGAEFGERHVLSKDEGGRMRDERGSQEISVCFICRQ